MTVQLQNELEHEPVRTGKKPQIKHPRGRDSKQKAAKEESPPQKPLPPQRSESESSRSSQSSSFEESRESFDSSQTSPTSEGIVVTDSFVCVCGEVYKLCIHVFIYLFDWCRIAETAGFWNTLDCAFKLTAMY